MATSSSILSYIDNVVSSYDSANTESKYTNLKVNNDAELLNVDVSGKAVIDTLNIVAPPGEYRLPGTSPNSGDYIAYGGVTNTDGSKQLEFKYFNSSSVTIHTLGDLLLHPSRNDGTIVHVANGTSILAADTATEYKVIDNKPPVLTSDISLNDRLLVSVTRAGGTVPDLKKMTLRNLLDFVEKENPGTSAIKYLTSNTGVQANQYDVEITVDDGVLNRSSMFSNTGITLHGNLNFINDLDVNAANASFEPLSNGYKLVRYGNILNFDFEGTQTFIVRPTTFQLGNYMYLDDSAYLDYGARSYSEFADDVQHHMDSNAVSKILNDASFELKPLSSLTVNANSGVYFPNMNYTYSFDQSVSTADVVAFDGLVLPNPTNSTGLGTGPFVLQGGGSVGMDLYVGNDLVVTNDIQVGNDATILGVTNSDDFVATTSITTPYINVTANTDSAVVNTGYVSAGNADVLGNLTVGNDIYAANAVFAETPPVILSSIAYKENVNKFDSGLNLIMNMNPVTYDRKNKSNKNEIGFIAEEMETILPNLVKSGHGLKGIQYDQIVPILVSAMQQQQKKIEELENKLK